MAVPTASRVDDNALIRLAADAAKAVPGVHGLGNALYARLAGAASAVYGQRVDPGVRISRSERGVAVSVAIVVDYPKKVQDVAAEVRQHVADAVRASVPGPFEVDVTVDDVYGPYDAQRDAEREAAAERRREQRERVQQQVAERARSAQAAASDAAGSVRDSAASAADTVSAAAGSAADTARDAADSAVDAAPDAAGSAREAANSAARTVRERASDAADAVEADSAGRRARYEAEHSADDASSVVVHPTGDEPVVVVVEPVAEPGAAESDVDTSTTPLAPSSTTASSSKREHVRPAKVVPAEERAAVVAEPAPDAEQGR